MNHHFQEQNPQSETAVLARFMAATTIIFRRKEPAIRGLEVSDSTWEAWEAAVCKEQQELPSDSFQRT